MKKADYKFHRDRKEQIQRDSSQSPVAFFYFNNYLFSCQMKYLLLHEDYISLNINQKIQAKDYYLKFSI